MRPRGPSGPAGVLLCVTRDILTSPEKHEAWAAEGAGPRLFHFAPSGQGRPCMPFDSILDTASARAALAPLDWQAVLAGDHPARVPLLAPILAPGELALLRGPAGIGKSWLALQLAFAVAQGQADVLGWRTGGEGRRVLFVDAQLARP